MTNDFGLIAQVIKILVKLYYYWEKDGTGNVSADTNFCQVIGIQGDLRKEIWDENKRWENVDVIRCGKCLGPREANKKVDSLTYLFNGKSTPNGLFTAESLFISKCLQYSLYHQCS